MTGDITHGTYIDFMESKPYPKTKVWTVTARNGGILLGCVKWYSSWRCYAFYPSEDTVYEQKCLREISDFCEMQTKTHRGWTRRPKK